MDVTREAKIHILKVEKLSGQLNELKELQLSLKIPALDMRNEIVNDIEIGVPTSNTGFVENGVQTRWHRVQLKNDLNISSLQNQIKEMLVIELKSKEKEIESELKKLILEEK